MREVGFRVRLLRNYKSGVTRTPLYVELCFVDPAVTSISGVESSFILYRANIKSEKVDCGLS